MIQGDAPQAPLLYSPSELMSFLRCRARQSPVSSLQAYFQSRFVRTLSSGRASLFFLLEALKKRRGGSGRAVIIPAYTCPTVPHAVRKAGLSVRLCRIQMNGFSFDMDHLEQLLDTKVLAVIPTHLFGFPVDIAGIKQRSLSVGAAVIEDFSHSVGARIHDIPVGSLGDAGFCSLGRGKVLTTYQGGVLVSSSADIAHHIDSALASLPMTGRLSSYRILLQLGLLYFLISGRKWGLVMRSPFDPEKKEAGVTFSPAILSQIQQGLLNSAVVRLDETNKNRVRKAAYYEEGMKGIKGLFFPSPLEGGKPIYMYFPVIFEDPNKMAAVFKTLRKQSIGVTRLYQHPLNQLLSFSFENRGDQFSHTEWWVDRILFFPCHPYLPIKQIDHILDVVQSLP